MLNLALLLQSCNNIGVLFLRFSGIHPDWLTAMSDDVQQLKLITLGTCRFHFHPDVAVTVDKSTNLRQACKQAGVPLSDKCGGKGQCTQCIITIVNGINHCLPKTHLEEGLFFLGKRERLSCQCYIDGDVVIATRDEIARHEANQK